VHVRSSGLGNRAIRVVRFFQFYSTFKKYVLIIRIVKTNNGSGLLLKSIRNRIVSPVPSFKNRLVPS